MSDMDQSQSSVNYQAILQNLLDQRKQKQWQQVPSIVYMTIKAIFNQTQIIQQNLSRQRQLLSEQSVRLKQLSVEMQDLTSKNQLMYEISQEKQKESAFKKNRKNLEKGLFLKSENRFDSNKRKANDTFSNINSNIKQQGYKSFAQRSINPLIMQQIKTIAEQLMQQKNKQNNKKLLQLQNFNVQNSKKLHENITKTVKQMNSFRQQLFLHLQSKVRQIQIQLNRKLQSQRTNILNFVEQNAVDMEKIWLEINNIHLKISQLAEDKKLCYTNPVYIKQDDKNKQKYDKTKKNFIPQPENDKPNNETKIFESISNINKQLKQFKLKIMKQMTNYIKTQIIQQMLRKYQGQLNDKIVSINKQIMNNQKNIDSLKKQGLANGFSKSKSIEASVVRNQDNFQQSKKTKKSEQNIRTIKESLEKLQSYFVQKLKIIKKQNQNQIKNLQTNISKQLTDVKSQLHAELQLRQKTICQIVQTNYDNLSKMQQKQAQFDHIPLTKAVEKLSDQMILARYLHLGEKQCKQVIEWEKNVYNSMQQNYVWKKLNHIITVVASGLYRLEVGLFPENQQDKIQAFVMLNGTPISEIMNKQQSQIIKTQCRGLLFNQPVLLPSKSKIWVKIEKPFYGQAFIQVLKL